MVFFECTRFSLDIYFYAVVIYDFIPLCWMLRFQKKLSSGTTMYYGWKIQSITCYKEDSHGHFTTNLSTWCICLAIFQGDIKIRIILISSLKGSRLCIEALVIISLHLFNLPVDGLFQVELFNC